MIAGRRLDEQQRRGRRRRRPAARRAGADGRGSAAARGARRSFRLAAPARRYRGGRAARRLRAPQQMRNLQRRRRALHLRRRRQRHLRRDEIDRGQLLAEDALHLGERALPRRQVRRRRLLAHQRVDASLPWRGGGLLQRVPEMVGTGAEPEIRVERRIRGARLQPEVDRVVVPLLPAREQPLRIERDDDRRRRRAGAAAPAAPRRRARAGGRRASGS